ncbi:MAG: hypothetical protein ABR521_07475, partial [Gaiellaceae bacterium]
MLRTPKTFLLCALAGLALLGGSAAPAAAAAPCWRTVINDWLDGKIDGRYPVACYREAIDHLGDLEDLDQYSSAREDINRALQVRIYELTHGGGTTTTDETPPSP